MTDPIAEARRWYAEELRFTDNLKSPAIVEAFARVPRERFLGPGPWRVRSPSWATGPRDEYWTTEDADPCRVYHDVLIALDEAHGVNNGLPSLWAGVFDQLALGAGERVLHLGCGTGYYTAIAAELVGAGGRLTAVEIDPLLAARAKAALVPWPQVTVVNADGCSLAPDPADAIIVNGGATHPFAAWLDALDEGGRLLLPMTASDRWGGILLVTRQSAAAYAARFLRPAGFIHFTGARDPEAGLRFGTAFRRDRGVSVRSLRRAPEAPDATCWLEGAHWWLSTAAAERPRS